MMPRYTRRAPRTARPLRVVWLLALLAAAIGTGLSPPPAGAAARAPAYGKYGMVVSAERHATEAGAQVLRAGGNAVDAAVAVSFALGVTEPYHSGIGGGGFLLIRLADGEGVAVDARETAPAAATRAMYTADGVADDASRFGPLAVAVPGLVAGLELAHSRHGSLPWAQLLAPAIELADQGFPIGPRHVRMLEYWRDHGLAERFPATAAIQLPPTGASLEPGWRLVQKDLAATLRILAEKGARAFYQGPLAAAMAEEVQRRDGILTTGDLAAYRPKLREPLRGSYRGLEVWSFPPPSSGGVALLQMLNILEGFPVAELGDGSSAAIHAIAEAMKLAFADRAAYLGDADFVDVPVVDLTAKDYAARLRARIAEEAVLEVTEPGLPVDPTEGGGTTHFSITDAAGNAVAVTQTINLLFGSGITVPGTGIVLNDEMDDFSVAPDTPNAFGLVDTRGANAVAPGKRPLSSMTPTLVLEGGNLRFVTGSPGGPRIITTVLLSILQFFDWGLDVSAAVSAPRFHHQWVPNKLFVEPEIPADVRTALEARGHQVVRSKRHWSSAQAIAIDPETGWQWGGSDPRSDGLARGLHEPPALPHP